MIVFVVYIYFIVRYFPHYITVNLGRESYISGRMQNTFSYGSGLSQLPKRDNLHIKDKRPAPNLSVIRKFYHIIIIMILLYIIVIYIAIYNTG